MRRSVQLLLTLVLFGLLVYGVRSIWSSSTQIDRQQAESQQRQKELKAKVSAMAARHEAVTDWENRLANGQNFRISSVLTVELQDLWQSGRPVLFTGTVEDIERVGTDRSKLSIRLGVLGRQHMFTSSFAMELECETKLLENLVDFVRAREVALDDDIAVVASIGKILASSEQQSDGESRRLLTGSGTCVDVMPLR